VPVVQESVQRLVHANQTPADTFGRKAVPVQVVFTPVLPVRKLEQAHARPQWHERRRHLVARITVANQPVPPPPQKSSSSSSPPSRLLSAKFDPSLYRHRTTHEKPKKKTTEFAARP